MAASGDALNVRETARHMRFKRSDLPGIVVAALIPALLSYVVFDGWNLLHHEGTPLLGAIAMNLAVVGGVIAYLTRYIAHWRAFAGLAGLFALAVAGVFVVQATGRDHTLGATALKWAVLLLFLALNALLVIDLLIVAVNPYLVRRDERRAAGN